jgi:2-polyprenyl-3-methyl-5-hydroxy-6-metoxy-1,4-benzoquinol methylase
MTTNEDKRRQAAGQSPLEHMIGYSGEADMPDQSFDLALFRQLNKEFEANPVVPAPRPFSTEYTADIGHKRCEMLDRKIGISGRRVLELGCGTGMMSRALAKDFDCEVVGVDICLYEDWHHPVEGNLIQLVHDVTSDNNDILGQFDRVVSFAVFEHIVHPHAALVFRFRTCRTDLIG